MSDSKITYQQYWKQVSAIVKDVIDEMKEQDEDRDWAIDYLHQTVDGHEWVIYTWANPYVLIHSQNEDALFDDMGATEATSYSEIMMKMAFYALYADCAQELEEKLERRRR
jgi:hypothetical protein